MGALADGVVRERLPGPGRGGRGIAGHLRRIAEPLEGVGEPVAQLVPRDQRPLVGDLGHQRRGRQGGGPLPCLGLVARDQPGELLGVDLARQVRRDADGAPVGRQVGAAADRLERAADGPDRVPERGEGAGVHHVGPEAGRQAGAAVGAGVEQQVGEHGRRPGARERREGPAVDLHREATEESRAKHRSILGPAPGRVNATGEDGAPA